MVAGFLKPIDFSLKCWFVICVAGDATGGKELKANTGKQKMSQVYVFSCVCSFSPLQRSLFTGRCFFTTTSNEYNLCILGSWREQRHREWRRRGVTLHHLLHCHPAHTHQHQINCQPGQKEQIQKEEEEHREGPWNAEEQESQGTQTVGSRVDSQAKSQLTVFKAQCAASVFVTNLPHWEYLSCFWL